MQLANDDWHLDWVEIKRQNSEKIVKIVHHDWVKDNLILKN